MNESNDHWLQITGRVNIPVPLEVDTEYQFTGVIGTYGINQGSKQDGSFNYIYKAQFVEDVHLVKGEQVIKAEDKERKSQTLRKAIYAKGFEYDSFMNYILRNLDEIALGFEVNEI